MIDNFPHYPQHNQFSCGPTCLKIIAKHYSKIIDINPYSKKLNEKGLSIYELCEAAENLGFRVSAHDLSLENLKTVKKPVILYWNKNHYLVLYQIRNDVYYVSDPAAGLQQYSKADFTSRWFDGPTTGKVILIEPAEKFAEHKNNKSNYLAALEFLIRHLSPYRKKSATAAIGNDYNCSGLCISALYYKIYN